LPGRLSLLLFCFLPTSFLPSGPPRPSSRINRDLTTCSALSQWSRSRPSSRPSLIDLVSHRRYLALQIHYTPPRCILYKVHPPLDGAYPTGSLISRSEFQIRFVLIRAKAAPSSMVAAGSGPIPVRVFFLFSARPRSFPLPAFLSRSNRQNLNAFFTAVSFSVNQPDVVYVQKRADEKTAARRHT